jgi:hypothetical protein
VVENVSQAAVTLTFKSFAQSKWQSFCQNDFGFNLVFEASGASHELPDEN